MAIGNFTAKRLLRVRKTWHPCDFKGAAVFRTFAAQDPHSRSNTQGTQTSDIGGESLNGTGSHGRIDPCRSDP